MTVPDYHQAYMYLGRALSFFTKDWKGPMDKMWNGWRIRIDKVEDARHRDDMVWEDLGLDSIIAPESGDIMGIWRIRG